MSERTEKYTWCGLTLPEEASLGTNAQKCYFLDEDGYIFDEAPYFSGEVYFKFYGDVLINADNPLGAHFLKENFKQLVFFKNVLLDIGLKPAELYAGNDGDIEIFLSKGAFAAIKPKIMLKADSNFQNAAENLEAALNTEPLQSDLKNKYSSLLYIDLRFGNKVYYKFR